MAFKLTIVFGGLCLFVEQSDADAPGLFVLMPAMQMPGMEHEALAAFDGGYLGDDSKVGTVVRLPLVHQRVRLNGMFPGGAKQGLPSTLAPVSRYGGGPVKKSFTTMDPPDGPLAARVELDLGACVETFGVDGLLEFDYDQGIERRRVHGLARVTLDLPDPIEYIDVAGARLFPRNGQLEVAFVNVPGGRLEEPARTHPKGEVVRHFQAYYSMLGRTGPNPRVAETTIYPGGSFSPSRGASKSLFLPMTMILGLLQQGGSALSKPLKRRQFLGALTVGGAVPALSRFETSEPKTITVGGFWVDPVDCTVGGGCAESDPDCT
jgi:hypothetical protein